MIVGSGSRAPTMDVEIGSRRAARVRRAGGPDAWHDSESWVLRRSSLVVARGCLGSRSSGREARADRIVLRGGGQIRGKVMPDPKHARPGLVLTERGKTPLTFQKAQIVEVIAEPSPLDDYVARAGRDARRPPRPSTSWASGASEHKLPDLADLHYEAAVKLDKTFAPAHQKLGHVLLRRPLAQRRRAPRGPGAGPLQGEVDHSRGEGAARPGQPRRRPSRRRGSGGSGCSARRSSTAPTTAAARPRRN